jgi:hypothetical protein
MMARISKASLSAFVILLSLTMVGEGMITVTLLWTSASIGQTPLFIGTVLFVMNIVPFLAQFLFRPLRRAIEQHPLGMIIVPRMIGVVAAVLAGATLGVSSLSALIAIAACLTFITFISQQCIETLMGQLTVAGVLDAGTSARLSQTALQSGVFVGNALAGILIAKAGTNYVFFGIAVSFASSLLLLFAAPSINIEKERPVGATASHAAKPVKWSETDHSLWLLLLGMGFLAVQLSGFNFFVPLVFERSAELSAADYGMVSAAAGGGALLATFIPVSTRKYLGYIACLAVVIGDMLVTLPTGMILTLMFAFGIGFGFNTSRIQVRQAIFERLTTKQESALWGGRVTVTFRGVSAGAPLVFGLVVADQASATGSWILAAIGVLAMGVVLPACLFLSKRMHIALSPT